MMKSFEWGGVLVARTRRPRGATRALAAAAAALAVCAAALCALLAPAPSRAQEGAAAGADGPFILTKTATNLNESFESDVTLSVDPSQATYDVVFVVNADSYQFCQDVRSELPDLMEDVGVGRVNIGVVAGGSIAPRSADPVPQPSMVTLLELTPLTEDNLGKIVQAFETACSDEVAGENRVANLESGVGIGTKMLDDSALASGGDGSNQCLVLVSEGNTDAWGTGASDDPYQTFVLDTEQHSFDDYVKAREGSITNLVKGGLRAWMASEELQNEIESDIAQYGNSDYPVGDPVTGPYLSVGHSLPNEAAAYRLALYYDDVMNAEGPSGNRRYLFSCSPMNQDNPISTFAKSLMSGLASLDEGGNAGACEQASPNHAASTMEAIEEFVGASPYLGGYLFIDDVIGYGSDDGHGNAYDFSFVTNPSTMTLQIGEESYSVIEEAEFPDQDVSDFIRIYAFGKEGWEKDDACAALYYFPQGLAAAEEAVPGIGAYGMPGGNTEDESFLFALIPREEGQGVPHPSEGVRLSYRVRLDDPQTAPGTYGTYDEDGSEGHEGLLTNESARVGVVTGSTSDGAFEFGGVYEFPRPTVSYTVQPDPSERVEVTPADIIIYMGGDEGNEGVVDDSGQIVGGRTLPEFGFTFELPASLEAALAADGADVTDVTFSGAGGRTWAVEPYPGSEGAEREVFSIVPAEGQDAVRVQFTTADGNKVTSDEFEVGREVNTTFAMSLYTGAAGEVTATYDGVSYAIVLGSGTLSVRGTTDAARYASVHDAGEPAAGEPAVRAPEGTVYTINGSEVRVADDSGVALLFDGIIDAEGEDRTGALVARAESEEGLELPGEAGTRSYELRYLDLVDTHNGNAWVAATDGQGNGRDVTVSWPLPEGTNGDTEFSLVHFRDLDRDMAADDVESMIENCEVESVPVEVTDTHVTFKVESGDFSPFALVWDAGSGSGAGEAPQPEPEPGPGAAIPATGDPSWLLAPLAACSAGALALAASRRRG